MGMSHPCTGWHSSGDARQGSQAGARAPWGAGGAAGGVGAQRAAGHLSHQRGCQRRQATPEAAAGAQQQPTGDADPGAFLRVE